MNVDNLHGVPAFETAVSCRASCCLPVTVLHDELRPAAEACSGQHVMYYRACAAMQGLSTKSCRCCLQLCTLQQLLHRPLLWRPWDQQPAVLPWHPALALLRHQASVSQMELCHWQVG